MSSTEIPTKLTLGPGGGVMVTDAANADDILAATSPRLGLPERLRVVLATGMGYQDRHLAYWMVVGRDEAAHVPEDLLTVMTCLGRTLSDLAASEELGYLAALTMAEAISAILQRWPGLRARLR